MNFKKPSARSALLLCTAVLLLILWVCISSFRKNEIPQGQASPNLPPPPAGSASASYPRRNLDDLFKTSNLVALCTVTSEPESFFVKRVDAGVDIMSDQCAKIDKIFMGEAAGDGETIVIRSLGGTVGEHTVSHSDNPVLKTDHQYLLFLYKSDRGGGNNTAGDYYYIRGLRQGVYYINKNDDTFTSPSGEKLTEAFFMLRSEEYKDHHYSAREERLKILKNNLEYGAITQEDYDKSVAQMDEYAEIIEDLTVK